MHWLASWYEELTMDAKNDTRGVARGEFGISFGNFCLLSHHILIRNLDAAFLDIYSGPDWKFYNHLVERFTPHDRLRAS